MAQEIGETTVTLEIDRFPANTDRMRFTVPVSGPARLLDALMHIRRHADPSLGFRYACRVGMCGSCAVVIDGREVLACLEPVAGYKDRVAKVEPLKGLPRQRDLMVDMAPFLATFTDADAAFRPTAAGERTVAVVPPDAGDRPAIERQNGCITCGACHSAAQPASGEAPALGPAALNRLMMLSLDERDAKGRARLATAARDRDFLASDLARLKDICPVEVPLADGLERLGRLLDEPGAAG